MSLAQAVLGLPQSVGRMVVEFLFAPAAALHAELLKAPASLQGLGTASRAVALARTHHSLTEPGVDWHREMDWRSLAHRTAVLPGDTLEALAWYLGLAAHSQQLRRVVLRDDLLGLQSGGIVTEHLEFVYNLPELPDEAGSAPALPVGDFPASLWRAGWASLAQCAASLPEAIGTRLLLKLPAQAARLDGATRLSGPVFEHVRGVVVASILPEFDDSLLSLAAS